MSVCKQPECKTCRARMRHLEQEDERLRVENARLRTALEYIDEKCVDMGTATRVAGAAISPSESGPSGRGEKGGA